MGYTQGANVSGSWRPDPLGRGVKRPGSVPWLGGRGRRAEVTEGLSRHGDDLLRRRLGAYIPLGVHRDPDQPGDNLPDSASASPIPAVVVDMMPKMSRFRASSRDAGGVLICSR